MRNYKIIEDYRYKGRNDNIVPCGIVGCNKGICYSVKRKRAKEELNEILADCETIEQAEQAIKQAKKEHGLPDDFSHAYCGFVAIGVYKDLNEVHWWVRED